MGTTRVWQLTAWAHQLAVLCSQVSLNCIYIMFFLQIFKDNNENGKPMASNIILPHFFFIPNPTFTATSEQFLLLLFKIIHNLCKLFQIQFF
jgi:hypothetical protein